MNLEEKISEDLNKSINKKNPDVWDKIINSSYGYKTNYAKNKVHKLHPRCILRPMVTFMMLLLTITFILYGNVNIMLFRECVLAAEYPKNTKNVNDDYEVDYLFKQGVTQFSLNSASELLKENKINTNYSPISLYFALLMAATGAHGKTYDEFLDVLGIPDKDVSYLSEQAGMLFRSLYFDNGNRKLQIANSLWLSEKAEFKKSYIYNIKKNFFASLYSVDFEDPLVDDMISKWISNNIGDTFKPNINISPDTLIALINTIYFYDEWVDEFKKSDTLPDTFNLNNENKVTCDFMNGTMPSNYAQGVNFSRASLSLKSAGEMRFVLPDKGTDIRDLLKTPEALEEALFGGKSINASVNFKIPKFSFKSSYNLNDTLNNLGLKSAFNNADFSVMSDIDSSIKDIVQETQITISEKGVEAGAFTRILLKSGGFQEKAELILDRPFIYAITASDGTLLFIGVCMNPTAS